MHGHKKRLSRKRATTAEPSPTVCGEFPQLHLFSLNKIQVFVATRDGRKIMYEADRFGTVAVLKRHIGHTMGVPMGFSQLVYKGRLLPNRCVLEELGIKRMATMELFWKPLVLTPRQYRSKELELERAERTQRALANAPKLNNRCKKQAKNVCYGVRSPLFRAKHSANIEQVGEANKRNRRVSLNRKLAQLNLCRIPAAAKQAAKLPQYERPSDSISEAGSTSAEEQQFFDEYVPVCGEVSPMDQTVDVLESELDSDSMEKPNPIKCTEQVEATDALTACAAETNADENMDYQDELVNRMQYLSIHDKSDECEDVQMGAESNDAKAE